ncbi:uncharacterized protein LOC121866817 [Homarus americanus]|uniref:uncharacterized protein LOC121866817 n=1 Tax=Homarus americanus TaxID=6706 RepID=UPI001C4686DE|nr:uncharacterized protein LOC121866817 [Homarus americanus]
MAIKVPKNQNIRYGSQEQAPPTLKRKLSPENDDYRENPKQYLKQVEDTEVVHVVNRKLYEDGDEEESLALYGINETPTKRQKQSNAHSRDERLSTAAKVNIQNLPENCTRETIQNTFEKYGKIQKIWLKEGESYGFIIFQNVAEA